MDKRLKLLCACLMVMGIGGCSNDACQEDECLTDDLDIASHALKPRNFDVSGGSPWSEVTMWEPRLTVEEQRFGTKVVKGKFSTDTYEDVITGYHKTNQEDLAQFEFLFNSSTGLKSPQIMTRQDNAKRYPNAQIEFPLGSNIAPLPAAFGYDMAAGSYCPTLGGSNYKGDTLIVSIPWESYDYDASTKKFKKPLTGGVVMYRMITRSGKRVFWPAQTLYSSPYMLAGDVIAVGDLNGDGQPDLVYRSTPLDSATTDWKPERISVHLNLCEGQSCTTLAGSSTPSCTLKEDAGVANPTSGDTAFGSKLYVQDLEGKGKAEIIAIAPISNTIYFYKYTDGAKSLIQSREPLVAESGVSSIAFMDLDGDGDLDMLVGEADYDSRRGRIVSFKNPGKYGAFTSEGRQIEIIGDDPKARFGGGDIVIDDLNHDNVPDLIASSIGLESNSGHESLVSVFMGTKDGTIFSQKPYWKYKYETGEEGSTKHNINALGTSILTVDADNAGWKDIVASAPENTKNLTGNVRIIKSGTSSCYTADKCLISSVIDGVSTEKCYEADEVNPDNACQRCDPSKNNFGWAEVSCEGDATECKSAAYCDKDVGCTFDVKPDGTECGVSSCNNASLSLQQCQAGECTKTTENCGDYMCANQSGQNVCLTACTSAAQCANSKAVCKDNACVINTPPEIISTSIQPTPARIKPGETLTLAVTARDADGDVLTYKWSDNASSAGTFANAEAANTTFTVNETTTPGFYNLSINVCDDYDCVKSSEYDFSYEVYLDPENHAPSVTVNPSEISGHHGNTLELNALATDEDGDTLTYAWKIDPKYGSFVGSNTNSTAVFTINDTVNIGTTFQVSVTVSDGKASSESYATVTVINTPPEIITTSIQPIPARIKPSETLTLAVTARDADGDVLTYSWSDNGSSAGTFANAEAANTTFTVSNTTQPGLYTISVNVCDKHACVKSSEYDFSYEVYLDPTNHAPIVKVNPSEISGHRGDKFEVYAIASDEDEDTLTYEWNIDPDYGAIVGSATDPATVFSISNTVDNGTVFYVSVKVSDGKAVSESRTTVTVLDDIVMPQPIFVTPTDGDVVTTPFEVVGIVQVEENDADHVTLYDSNMNKLCVSDVLEKRWTCTLDVNTPGDLTLLAIYDDGINASEPTYITIKVAAANKIPVIESPENGATTTANVAFSGTVAATEGAVYVWERISDQDRTLVCQAGVQADGTWICVNDKLAIGEHSIDAYWKNGDEMSDFCPAVNFTVDATDTSLSITSITDGTTIDTYSGLYVTGTATSGAAVEVSITASSNNESIADCSTYADTTGRWYCAFDASQSSDETGVLANGTYTAYATTTRGEYDTTVEVSFNVENIIPNPPSTHTPKGGSCSMTHHAPTSTPWWLAICAAFGMCVLPLRRRNRD